MTWCCQRIRHCIHCCEMQEAVPGMRPCNIVPAGTLEHDEDGRLVCWDDPALQPSCHIFYGVCRLCQQQAMRRISMRL